MDLQAARALLGGRTARNTPCLSFAGARGWARVLGVADGDTLTLALPWRDGSVFKLSARLRGIDTAEMHGPDRARAMAARNRLCQLLGLADVSLDDGTTPAKRLAERLEAEPVLVWAVCGETEKWGRTLCDVFLSPTDPPEASLAERLVAEGFAVRYGGGCKAAAWRGADGGAAAS